MRLPWSVHVQPAEFEPGDPSAQSICIAYAVVIASVPGVTRISPAARREMRDEKLPPKSLIVQISYHRNDRACTWTVRGYVICLMKRTDCEFAQTRCVGHALELYLLISMLSCW